MARSTSFAPATPPGAISQILGSTWTDDDNFREKTAHEQSQINIWGSDPAGPEKIINHSSAITSGPFGCIAVRHTLGGGRPEVTVFHTLRAYMANPLELNPVDIVLKDKVYAFAGEARG
jgi:hypothetical protein